MGSSGKVRKVKKSSGSSSKRSKSSGSSKVDDDNGKKLRGSNAKPKILGALVVFVLVMMVFYRGGDAEVVPEVAPLSATDVKLAKKKKKASKSQDEDGSDEAEDEGIKVSDADIIESKFGSLGWTKSQGPLVTKRPPRECSIRRIAPQVETPFFITNKKTKWKRRIATCIRLNKQECSKMYMDDFKARRWKVKASKQPLPDRLLSTFVLSDSLTLERLQISKPKEFQELYYVNEGSTYLNALLGASGLDGNLHEQFAVRVAFSKQFGCAYNALKAQIPQFRYDIPAECEKMERALAKGKTDSWLLSTFGPDNNSVKSTNQKSSALGASFCEKQDMVDSIKESQALAFGLLKSPFKLQGKLFDVRGFLLIGSTLPFMTFFHQGYIRLSESAKSYTSPFLFDEGASDITLEMFQEVLAKDKITGSHYTDTFLKSSMKQLALLAFHSARTKIMRRKGSFQLFSIDYVIDSSFRVYLEKTAGNPSLTNLANFDPSGMVADMHDLVQELQEVPVAFEGMVKGDKYGQWELIFSELSETCHKIIYNPCHAFIDFNDKDLVKQNKKVGKVQATAKRLENEDKRIVKKTEEKKKNTCKEQKIPYPGTKCNKLLESMEEAEFAKLFKEHESSFNPNDFSLPKPGQVFPHEIV